MRVQPVEEWKHMTKSLFGLAVAAASIALLGGGLDSVAAQSTPAPAATATPQATATSVDAAAVYKSHCAACHGDKLQGGGGPALISPGVAGQSTADLSSTIKETMPLTNPGSLSDAEVAALTGYIVAQNKH
jgi:mono/diheme cytochrome c family protein